MYQDVTVTVEKRGNKAVVNLEGDITTFAEESITKAVQSALSDCRSIVLNFEGVEYINSSGIAILISIVTEMMKKGGKLLIANLTPHYQKIFRMVGLNQYTTVFNNLEEALAAQD